MKKLFFALCSLALISLAGAQAIGNKITPKPAPVAVVKKDNNGPAPKVSSSTSVKPVVQTNKKTVMATKTKNAKTVKKSSTTASVSNSPKKTNVTPGMHHKVVKATSTKTVSTGTKKADGSTEKHYNVTKKPTTTK